MNTESQIESLIQENADLSETCKELDQENKELAKELEAANLVIEGLRAKLHKAKRYINSIIEG